MSLMIRAPNAIPLPWLKDIGHSETSLLLVLVSSIRHATHWIAAIWWTGTLCSPTVCHSHGHAAARARRCHQGQGLLRRWLLWYSGRKCLRLPKLVTLGHEAACNGCVRSLVLSEMRNRCVEARWMPPWASRLTLTLRVAGGGSSSEECQACNKLE